MRIELVGSNDLELKNVKFLKVPEVPKLVHGCFDSVFPFLNDNCFHEK